MTDFVFKIVKLHVHVNTQLSSSDITFFITRYDELIEKRCLEMLDNAVCCVTNRTSGLPLLFDNFIMG